MVRKALVCSGHDLGRLQAHLGSVGLLRRQRAPYMNARVYWKVPAQGHWVQCDSSHLPLLWKLLQRKDPPTHTHSREARQLPQVKQTLVHF